MQTKKKQISATKTLPLACNQFLFTPKVKQNFELFEKASLAYIQASKGSYRPFENCTQKNVSKYSVDITFYIGHLNSNFPLPHVLQTIITILPDSFLNICIHFIISTMQKFQTIIKKSPIFLSFQSFTSSFSLLGLASHLTPL